MTNADPSQKAEIIDHIYDVALDPERYEQLLDAWEKRMHPLRGTQAQFGPDAGQSDEYSEFAVHARRAGDFLDRLREPDGETWQTKLATEIAATFCATPGGRILEANSAAELLFGIQIGKDISVLKLAKNEAAELIEAIVAASGKSKKSSLLRFTAASDDRAIVFHIAPISGLTNVPMAMVRTSELGWPENLTKLMKDAFKLTLAEVEIVRGLVEGKNVKTIGTERRRSLETVRSQLRSVLAKTETRSQTELIRITLSLMDVVGHTNNEPETKVATAGSLKPIPFETMTMPDGRRYDYIEYGSPNGRPCLYLPIDYGLTRWPLSAEAEALKRNIRVIVPVRAGYGHSSKLPPRVDYAGETGADLARLLKHLNVEKTAVLCLGADIRYAMRLAAAEPSVVSGILACSGTLPTQTAEQYERMGKWHRFILANARYAPLILPFLVKAGFSLARRIGKERFLNSVNADSPADVRTFALPEVREAMLLGSEIALSDWHIAHEAFARECIDSESNWADTVHKCPVPVRMLQGAEDPQSPKATMLELVHAYPTVNISIVENAGQLLFFQEWRMALDELEAFLP
jgi:pimeloyl-ACP methyl ester carboxylesterase/DNA-binding NarL/FixJ family response regulator